MTLNKNKTIAKLGRRTRLRNHDVQKRLEALIEVWSDELADRVELRLRIYLCWKLNRSIAVSNPGRFSSAVNCVAPRVTSGN